MDELIVDFGDYGLDTEDISLVSDEKISELGKSIVQILKTHNFCYLKNHGIKQQLIRDYMKASAEFFKLSSDEKNAYAIGTDYHFGWVKLEGMVVNSKSSVGDLNEFFLYTPYSYNEKWPPVKEFEELTKQFYGKSRELGLRFCDVLSLALDQPKDFLRNAHRYVGSPKGNYSPCKTLLYPPIEPNAPEKPGQFRIGHHTDVTTVTFDFQDGVRGLEVQSPTGDFVAADPIPGTVVVYLGDVMQRMKLGNLTAPLHGIPIPSDENLRKSTRQSLIFFLIPDEGYEIKSSDELGSSASATAKELVTDKIAEECHTTY